MYIAISTVVKIGEEHYTIHVQDCNDPKETAKAINDIIAELKA